jgi:hypothetical protein
MKTKKELIQLASKKWDEYTDSEKIEKLNKWLPAMNMKRTKVCASTLPYKLPPPPHHQ